MTYNVEWHLPALKPLPDEYVIVETLDGEYIVDRLKSFDEWSEMVIRWGYMPQEIDAKIENILSDLAYFKEENECLKVDLRNATEKLKNEKELNEHRIDYLEEQNEKLKRERDQLLKDAKDHDDEIVRIKKQVDLFRDKYMDIAGKYYNERQRDAFVGKKTFDSIAEEYREALCEEEESKWKENIKKYSEHDAIVSEELYEKCKVEIGKPVTSGECDPHEFDSRSDNGDGDEHLTEDDLCELFESKDARPIGEVSVDELRDIFLKVLREAKERERAKAADEDDGK